MAADSNPKLFADFSPRETGWFYAFIAFSAVLLALIALPAFLTDSNAEPSVAGGGGEGESASAAVPAAQEVTVIMTEFAFEPSSFEFEAGERVRFVVVNRGAVPHELRLTSAASADQHADEGHDHDGPAEEPSVLVDPGATAELEVTFTTDSDFELAACLLPGHFEAGMQAPLAIAGATPLAASSDHDAATDQEEEDGDHETAGEAEHEDSGDHAEANEPADEQPAGDESAAHAGDGPDGAAVDRQIDVVLSDFAFAPAAIEVTRGETVRFVLENEGGIEHEFRLSTEHAVDEHLAGGHEDHASEESGHGHGDLIVLVPAGETRAVDVTFDDSAEFTVVACLLEGHFEAGMGGTITIAG